MPLAPPQTDFRHPDSNTIQSLFNAIGPKYDFLNSFFSFGLDLYWRKRAVGFALEGAEQSILDLGVGTGKSLKAFVRAHGFRHAVGCDFSQGMLAGARTKFQNSEVMFVTCDFHELPFPSESFDIVTGSFILRSVQNLDHFFSEVLRVLKPEGKAVFLELTRPKNRLFWSLMYQPYLKFYIPLVGKIFSRHEHAYQFLSQSIQSFVEPERIQADLAQLGFMDSQTVPLTFGAATVLKAERPR